MSGVVAAACEVGVAPTGPGPRWDDFPALERWAIFCRAYGAHGNKEAAALAFGSAQDKKAAAIRLNLTTKNEKGG